MTNLSGSTPMDDGDDYETQNHMDTLVKAHGILNDPVKMKRVHALAGRHGKAIQSIRSVKDLKNIYDEKFGAGSGDGNGVSSGSQQNSLEKAAVSHDGNGSDANSGGAVGDGSGVKSKKQNNSLAKLKVGADGNGNDGN